MRILCFGDSNTYGFDPRSFLGDRYPAEDRWTDILENQTSWEVMNAGVNGGRIPFSPHALRLLSEYAPVDVLFIMLGTNDLLQGVSASEAAVLMEAFLSQLLPHCKAIVLAAPPPMKRGAWVPTDALVTEFLQLVEEYQQLAKNWRFPLSIPEIGISNWPSMVFTSPRKVTMPLPDSFWIILTAELSGRYCDDYQRQPTDRHPGLLFPVVLSPSGGRIRLRPQSHELPSGKPRQSVPGGGGRNCILDMRGSLILGL